MGAVLLRALQTLSAGRCLRALPSEASSGAWPAPAPGDGRYASSALSRATGAAHGACRPRWEYLLLEPGDAVLELLVLVAVRSG